MLSVLPGRFAKLLDVLQSYRTFSKLPAELPGLYVAKYWLFSKLLLMWQVNVPKVFIKFLDDLSTIVWLLLSQCFRCFRHCNLLLFLFYLVLLQLLALLFCPLHYIVVFGISRNLQRSMDATRDFLRGHGDILFADHCQSYLLLS